MGALVAEPASQATLGQAEHLRDLGRLREMVAEQLQVTHDLLGQVPELGLLLRELAVAEVAVQCVGGGVVGREAQRQMEIADPDPRHRLVEAHRAAEMARVGIGFGRPRVRQVDALGVEVDPEGGLQVAQQFVGSGHLAVDAEAERLVG